jgi:ArsR family transcriptional regulator, arsenate/arsenite/antimonite-responsive transcriptional repressor
MRIRAYLHMSIEESLMRELTRSLGLLSDETKLRILNVLNENESCVCEVEMALGITQSAASRGLIGLCNAGFIKTRKDGPWSLYSIDQQGMRPFQRRLFVLIINEINEKQITLNDRNNLKEARRISPRALAGMKE